MTNYAINYTIYDLTKRVAKILEVQDDGQFVCWLNTTLSESNYRLVEILDALTTKIENSEKVQAAFPDFTDDDQFYRYLDDHFVAWKIWSREDIKAYLTEEDYPATEHNVDAMISCDLSCLNDCTDRDWEIIGMAFVEAKENGMLEKNVDPTKRVLTIVGEEVWSDREREIPFKGPIVPILGGPIAPIAISGPRWEIKANDDDGTPYVVIWETNEKTFNYKVSPDYVLKYDPCYRRFCYSDPEKYVIRK